jgi:hypothetical protein
MKKKNFTTALVAPTLFSLIMMSCTHDKTTLDTSSPAFHITQSESIAIPASVELPANLPNGNTRVATFYAIGVQTYKAQQVAGSNPAVYEWVFVAPSADLYDITNQKAGTHSAGPDWQISAADSMFGQSFTPPRTAPSADPNSIDWLLLMPKTGKTPTGIFANVSYVQRIATNGGKAPATPPVSETDVVDVPYTAVYRFTKQN